MNLARWFRWFPIAVGRKRPLTLAEQRSALGTGSVPPKRTQERNDAKLRLKRIHVVRRRA